jgi:hypothetical protein
MRPVTVIVICLAWSPVHPVLSSENVRAAELTPVEA